MPSYSSGGVIVDAEDAAANTLDAQIGSITSVTINTNTETVQDDSGGIYNEGSAVTQIAPDAAIGSKAIQEVLSVIGVNGQCFVDASGDPGVVVFGKNRGDCLTTVSSSQHSSYTFANGLMTLGQLTASKGSDAEITFMIHAIYDGTNVPLVIAHNATLPATLIKEQFEIGLCAISGAQFKPESVTINFGQSVEKPRALAPTIYPERIAVSKVEPIFEFRGLDPSFVTVITAGAATHANTKVQLVKRQSGGSYVASATTQHIYFTTYGTVIKGTPFSVQGQGDAETSITIMSLYDGTNAPILFGTAAAYDTSPGILMSKAKPQLDEAERVRTALNKAGVATRIAAHVPEKHRKKLAALVAVDGSAEPGVRDKVILILQECQAENKATGLTEEE